MSETRFKAPSVLFSSYLESRHLQGFFQGILILDKSCNPTWNVVQMLREQKVRQMLRRGVPVHIPSPHENPRESIGEAFLQFGRSQQSVDADGAHEERPVKHQRVSHVV